MTETELARMEQDAREFAALQDKATAGPWHACNDGKCVCKTIMGEHHPVADVTHGEWGDSYPNVRLVKNENGMGHVAEAYIERMPYGNVPEEKAKANVMVIAAARSTPCARDVLALVEEIRRLRANLEMMVCNPDHDEADTETRTVYAVEVTDPHDPDCGLCYRTFSSDPDTAITKFNERRHTVWYGTARVVAFVQKPLTSNDNRSTHSR